jgi:aryl carrier-like protein
MAGLDRVDQAVAIVKAAHDGASFIVGYVTGRDVDVDQVRTGLSRQLLDYMIPHFIVALDEMPLTANGKIDRKALPSVDAIASLQCEYVAPANQEEQAVVAAFADALGLDRISAKECFFRLGGDSIRAIQVAARLRQAGYEVTPRQLFERPAPRSWRPFCLVSAMRTPKRQRPRALCRRSRRISHWRTSIKRKSPAFAASMATSRIFIR